MDRSTLTLTRHRVHVPRLSPQFRGFTILHLSDLHCKQFGDGQAMLLDLIAGLSFDVVALTGDMVTAGNVQLRPTLEIIEALRNRPIYFVSGNHEWGSGKQEQITRSFEKAGAMVLRNEGNRIQRGREQLWLAGIEDPVGGECRLEDALAGIPENDVRILLSHVPYIFPDAARNQVDLVLAGHTHGGQIRLPFLGAPYVPRQGFFPRWSYGLYRSSSTNMVVTSGLGETSIPVRYNAKPEVVLVTLNQAEGDEARTDHMAEMVQPLKKGLKNLVKQL
ncbi:metallophosphoesterase [Geobacter sp. DSM 9736]|uniref:metallophosphoesterase n=1 Tax=Geobacter sp. DSM 9736 TaxID=1277350 RepID=UPI0012FE3355|nr:metallophosphoesterase [Geobacter sp. DSM 9736]